MLDELTEYKVWTSDEQTRFIFSKISDNFTGVKRALKIIARHFLFEEGVDKPNFDRAEEALSAWLGCKNSEDEDISRIFNYFEKQVLNALEKERTNNKNDSQKEKVQKEKKKKILEKIRAFQKRDFKRKTDYLGKENELFLEDIIAQAYCDGPLKTMYLITDISDNEVIENDVITQIKKSKKDSKSYQNKENKFLKGISAYLLNDGKENEYIRLSSAEINGWFSEQKGSLDSISNDLKIKSKDEDFKNIFINKNASEKADKSNNDVVYHVDNEIIKHFSLVDDSELENNLGIFDTHLVYNDTSKGMQRLTKEKYQKFKESK